MVMRALTGGVLGIAVLACALWGVWTPSPARVASAVPKPLNAQPMIVGESLSGDTITLISERPGPQVTAWGVVTARLIGLNSPNPQIANECFAAEAKRELGRLLPVGSVAWVTTDTTATDEAGRALVYVWTSDGQFVNYLLAADGFVRAETTGADDVHYDVIAGASDAAFRRGAGLWAGCR